MNTQAPPAGQLSYSSGKNKTKQKTNGGRRGAMCGHFILLSLFCPVILSSYRSGSTVTNWQSKSNKQLYFRVTNPTSLVQSHRKDFAAQLLTTFYKKNAVNKWLYLMLPPPLPLPRTTIRPLPPLPRGFQYLVQCHPRGLDGPVQKDVGWWLLPFWLTG